MRRPFAAVLAALAVMGAGAALASNKPAPTQPVDKDKLYLGIWHQVARTANDGAKGCVSGEIRFTTDDEGVLIDRESCRMGDPNTGKERVIEGPVSFPDASNGARFHASHRVFGLFSAGSDYWVLDHDAAYSWFIVATPSFTELSIFTRDPQLPAGERGELVNRARQLGYDVTKLEFPAQPRA